jgi:hypothetical protein
MCLRETTMEGEGLSLVLLSLFDGGWDPGISGPGWSCWRFILRDMNYERPEGMSYERLVLVS